MTWLILGVLIGALMVFLANNRFLKVGWLDLGLIALAIVFFILAIVNYSGSMDELEPRAATFLFASFGVPGLILVAIAGLRMWRKRTQQPSGLAAGKS
ncbi:MAG: dehalogenase [Anaerolineae bacterium]|nr:dehalogenase [Anaerolineae bacterium]